MKPIVLPLIIALCTLLSGCIIDDGYLPIATTIIIMTTNAHVVDKPIRSGRTAVSPVDA